MFNFNHKKSLFFFQHFFKVFSNNWIKMKIIHQINRKKKIGKEAT